MGKCGKSSCRTCGRVEINVRIKYSGTHKLVNMKSKLLVLSFLTFTACGNQKDGKESSIEGRYVTSYQSEYSKAMDTIEIFPLNKDANTFYYVRRSGYRRISNGVLGPYEHKIDSSTCIYNPSTGELSEQQHGRVYSLSWDRKQLVSGSSVYKRIQ